MFPWSRSLTSAAAAVADGSLPNWSPAKLAANATRIHAVHWLPLPAVLALLNPHRAAWTNDFQRLEFARHFPGRAREVPPRAAWAAAHDLVWDLHRARTKARILERCIETVIRRIAASKNMEEEEWRRELFARSGERPVCACANVPVHVLVGTVISRRTCERASLCHHHA